MILIPCQVIAVDRPLANDSKPLVNTQIAGPSGVRNLKRPFDHRGVETDDGPASKKTKSDFFGPKIEESNNLTVASTHSFTDDHGSHSLQDCTAVMSPQSPLILGTMGSKDNEAETHRAAGPHSGRPGKVIGRKSVMGRCVVM